MNRSGYGKVVLVGAGPGDPDLLTVRAMRTIQQADAILYDRLVHPEVLSYTRSDCKRIFTGKSKGCHSLPQEEINELLYRTACEHGLVCRLKGGDPFIYGRGGEEVEFLHERGIDCEVVPGVTAASGVAAVLRLPLTHRQCSSSLRFHSAHRKRDEADVHFGDLTTDGISHVFYMAGTRLKAIREAFARFDPASLQTPVAVVRRGTLPDQDEWFGILADIEKHDLNLLPGDPVLVIVGEVVRHSMSYRRRLSATGSVTSGIPLPMSKKQAHLHA